MSYENPSYRQTYIFDEFDYGGAAGDKLDYVVGPKGKTGRLIDYGVMSVQEDFAGSTIEPSVQVGTTADPNAYGEVFSLVSATIAAGGLTVRNQFLEDEAGFATNMLDVNLPADTPVLVTSTEATGTPTGQGSPYLVIDWVD